MARYVRNRRTAPVTVWVCDWKIVLAKRGAPGDTVAVPERAFADPDLLAHIEFGLVEEVVESLGLAGSRVASSEAQRNGGRSHGSPR